MAKHKRKAVSISTGFVFRGVGATYWRNLLRLLFSGGAGLEGACLKLSTDCVDDDNVNNDGLCEKRMHSGYHLLKSFPVQGHFS